MRSEKGRCAVHIGPVGDLPGGVAQVVNVYRELGVPGWDIELMPTLTRKRDPRSVPLFMMAVARTLAIRLRRGETVMVYHLTQKGSFVREGALLLLGRWLHIPTVAFVHGSSFAAFATSHARIVKAVLSASTRIMVLSNESRDVVEGLGLGARSERVPNLVEVPVTAALMADRTPVVLFGGEVSKRKGFDVLLKAWARVKRDEWKLLVAGPLVDERLAVPQEDVQYLGAVPRKTLNDLQDTAAIAVLPSRAEALPMFLLESMARGCAVLGTRVGAVDELLQDGCGLVVTPGDAAALSTALQTLIDDSSRRQLLSANARMRVLERHSASAGAFDVARIWNSALQGRAAG